MSSTPRNYNDPRQHVHLARLLDRPEELAAENRARVLKQLRRSLDMALAMPEGDDRITLLDTLNTALGDALRYHQYYGEARELQAKLVATHPEAAEIKSEIGMLQQGLKTLHSKVREAEELDAANGTDVNRSAWFWFVHEMHGITDFMNNRLRQMGRISDVNTKPDPTLDDEA
jgi:hypothetical protein